MTAATITGDVPTLRGTPGADSNGSLTVRSGWSALFLLPSPLMAGGVER